MLRKTCKAVQDTAKDLKDVKRRINFLTVLGSIALGLSIGCSALTFIDKFSGRFK